MNRATFPRRIQDMGGFGVSILLAVAGVAAACSGSAAPAPTATLAPNSPVIVQSPAAPASAAIASTPVPEPTLAPTAAQADLPTPAAQVPGVQPAPAQPAPAQPAVATVRLPTPAPPPPTAVPEAPSRPPPVTVSMVLNLAERSFTPHQVHGNAGDTVALTFMGGTEQHTFTVSSLGIDVTIAARETKQFSFVMPVDGEVPFFCRLHGTASSGMHGLLIFH